MQMTAQNVSYQYRSGHRAIDTVNVSIQDSELAVITGLSGSGKSSLVSSILYPALNKHLHGSGDKPGKHDVLAGDLHLVRPMQRRRSRARVMPVGEEGQGLRSRREEGDHEVVEGQRHRQQRARQQGGEWSQGVRTCSSRTRRESAFSTLNSRSSITRSPAQ